MIKIFAVCAALLLLEGLGLYTSSDAAAYPGGGEASSRLSAGTPSLLGTTAATFAVLAGSTVANTGATVVNGNLGVSPGTSIIGFPPGLVVPPGAEHGNDAVAVQAQTDTTTAYNNLAGQACNTNLTSGLGGLTLTPGVYCFSSSAQLTGALTLDALGNPNAVFVFQIGGNLTTASSSSVVGIDSTSGQICEVYWQVGNSATLGTVSSFAGNLIALNSITLTTGANLSGRALALTGAVTMASNNVSASSCLPATIPPTVTGINPTSGPLTGGTTVTVTGSNFATAAGQTTVQFGAAAATGVNCSSTTSCTATSPAGNGTVDVTVTTGGSTSAINQPADVFTYLALGDVNGDGSVTSVDALCVLRMVVSLPSTAACPVPPPGDPIIALNETQGGAPTSVDALCILRGVVGLPATNTCPLITAPVATPVAVAAESSAESSGSAEAEVSLSPRPVPAGRNNSTTIQLQAKARTASLGAWTIDVGYDSKVVKVTACKASDGSVRNPGFAPGMVRIAGASAAGLTGVQTLASITLSVIGTKNGTNPLWLAAIQLADIDGKPLPTSAVHGALHDGTVTTPDSAPGPALP